MPAVQFAYDGQIRKFVLQFIRMLSNFQVEFGKDSNGNVTLQTIPVYYGDPSRQAAMILKNNSENTMNAVPAMSVYISGLQYDRDRLLNPTYEGVVRVRQQIFDPVTQNYNGNQDGMYSVDRLMPAPYKLTLRADIWTSNTEQKHQIIEQLLPLFNPSMEIQSSDNFVDWSGLSVVFITEVTYSSRTVPATTDENQIDISSLTFEIPMWLSLPAKVKKAGVVTQIIANIYSPEGSLNEDVVATLEGLMSQQRYTAFGYDVVFIGNVLTLYQQGVNQDGTNIYGTPTSWANLIELYGKLQNGISQVRLEFDYPDGTHEIVGTVAFDPTNVNNLLYSPISATLPANTLPAVNAIIDPFHVTVNDNILNPEVGTRYLILNPIGSIDFSPAPAWAGEAGTNLVAKANDIIQWNGSYWTVAFDSSELAVQYVTNLNTTTQYRWNGSQWVKSYEGVYKEGTWSLVI